MGEMNMKIVKVKNYDEMSEKASSIIVEQIQKKSDSVIGMATGSTPEGLYAQLIKENEAGNVSFEKVKTFNLDEYVGLDPNNPNSYMFYMKDKLFNHVNIAAENVHLPNGLAADLQKECEDYEKKLKEEGPVDIQILGIGTNGHIGFNEPGTSFNSRTQVVELTESTRNDNARFFDSIEEVPTQAITMGIESIMEAKEIILLASGEGKAEAMKRLIEGDISEDFPASILKKHNNVTIIADEAALSY